MIVDNKSPFGTYSLDCRRSLARKLARTTKVKPIINLIREVGGLRDCSIADVEVYGGQMRVYPGLNRSDKIMLGMPHVFDAKEREYLAAALKKETNPTFIDLGANIGAYSVFVNGLGLNTKIIAIEADPEIFARLDFNLPQNIIKMNVAVADQQGILPFYINETNRGENSLKEGSGKRIDVPATTLKQILEHNDIKKPTAIKIDVEGMEEKILSAYLASVTRAEYPKLLLVEHIHNLAVEKLLISAGYISTLKTKLNSVYEISDSH